MAFQAVRRSLSRLLTPQKRAFHRPESATHGAIHHQIEETIAKFQQEDIAGIHAQMPFMFKLFLPEAVLRKGWKMLQLIAGPIVSVGTPDISIGWLLNTARVPIQFKRMKMSMRMQTTKSGTVIGLRFVPSDMSAFGLGSAKSVWRPPEYDMSELYEEIKITLGNRGYAVDGTLTLPRTRQKSPCIILLGGSGPCDQDSTVQAAKPFEDLACGLAREGIASLRFDKVTLTHGKKLVKRADFTLTEEYCEHAIAAIQMADQHPKIASSRIFIAGHSLGAVVTPKLSASSDAVAGFILMAPPARPIYWGAIRQFEYLSKLESVGDNEVDDVGLRELRQAALLADSSDLCEATPADELPFGIGPSYWLDYRTFQPIVTTAASSKPVLVLQGEEDYQVTMKDDFTEWEKALKGMTNVELKSYEGLNHLFMRCTTPSKPTDYDGACNVEWCVVEDIARWVHAH